MIRWISIRGGKLRRTTFPGTSLVVLLRLALGCGNTTSSDDTRNGSSTGSGAPGASGGAIDSGSTPVSRDELYARAAVVIGSCIPDDGVNRNLDYLWHNAEIPQLWGRFATQAECLAFAGGGCQAVTRCLGYDITETQTCEAGCNGSVYSDCPSRFAVTFDCSSLGLSCVERGACAENPDDRCDMGTFVRSCTATGEPQTCRRDTVNTGPLCSALGLICEDGACRGLGEACDGGSYGSTSNYRVVYEGISCEGDTLVSCVEARVHRRDCAAIGEGFSCHTVDGATFCGLGADCVPGNQPGYPPQNAAPITCNGSVLNFCNAGRLDQIDCTDLGFTGCDAGFSGCTPNFETEFAQ